MTTPAAAAPEPTGSDAGFSIEARSLRLGVSASLVIAAAGLVAYGLSGSDALLLDGLYSGVMAASSLVAARIGANVVWCVLPIAPTPTATTARKPSTCCFDPCC